MIQDRISRTLIGVDELQGVGGDLPLYAHQGTFGNEGRAERLKHDLA